jgi:hypothetical protein
VQSFHALIDAGRSPPPLFAHHALQNVDAKFQGNGNSLPFTVILDYCYGVAAYNAWNSQLFEGMKAYREAHYVDPSDLNADFPPGLPPPGLESYDSDDDQDDDYQSDDSKDLNYTPSKRHTASRNVMSKAMDKLNRFLMRASGITPEMAAEREQKAIEAERQAAQEASRSLVKEWRSRLP